MEGTPPSKTSSVSAPSEPESPKPRRTSFLDNTKLLLLGMLALVAALVTLLGIANRSSAVAPDVLTDVVLLALSATNLTMLVALAFVLARNIVKLVVERRRGLPFTRFRVKLVAVLLGMTLIPAVLVLIVGSELIRNNVDRWFNADLDDVLSSANSIAGDYYQEQQRSTATDARSLAREIGRASPGLDAAVARTAIAAAVTHGLVDLVEVYRSTDGSTGEAVEPVADAASSALVRRGDPAIGRALAGRSTVSGTDASQVESLSGGGELIRAAAPIRAGPDGQVVEAVIVSRFLTGQFAGRARRITDAYEAYQQLRVLRRPLAGVYLSFFLMLTLMILVSATWMGLYLAKRITRPVQLLASAANEIGAGNLDHRIEASSRDEFGALIEAFNRMAGELGASRRRLEHSAVELERTHQDVEGRRRYVETVLDRVASGVVAVDVAGRIRAWNSAASRLLGFGNDVTGLPAVAVLGASELKPLGALLDVPVSDPARPQEVAITRQGREIHLSVVITRLLGPNGAHDGLVLVFDDISPLVRAQRVAAWREVARRLAHEIKNPLTPIQLCAERLQRHFARAPEPTRALVDECAATIVGEVESLKGLVDEFSQFARMPAPRAVPTDLHALLDDTLGLYRGLLPEVELRRRFADALPRVSVDPEQMRRVVVNLVDNAVEAMARRGVIEIETAYEPANALVRVVVADDGPGIPLAERDKLFLPYYSTKQRGSGLGLAIVRRIVAEHGGSIDVADNEPRGTRFSIELPA
jgi:two-component system nitrogen regulation sensor histidine kinase NtrY